MNDKLFSTVQFVTKSTPSDAALAAAFKALAHPARIAILRALASNERVCCGDIVDVLPLAQSTVSQHLQVLREAGLIHGEIEGRRSRYCVDGETLAMLAQGSAQLFEEIATAVGKCAPGLGESEIPSSQRACCGARPVGSNEEASR